MTEINERIGVTEERELAGLKPLPLGRRRAAVVINGEVVKRRRRALGLSQVELSLMTYTTVRVIGQIERGKSLDPPTSTTLRLAKALSVTVEALCAGNQAFTSR